MTSLKQKAIKGVFWTFSQQISVQIINLGVQIVLARVLSPDIFGLVAMIAVFTSIGQILMDGGMTSSLIRSRKVTQLDYSTVFYTNLFISTLVYIIIFLAAPSIAFFYNQSILIDILRVMSLSFIARSFAGVHTAKLTKELDFKTQMKIQIPSTVIGGMVGIILALNGFGVWSLVWLNLSQAIIFAIQNWMFSDWRPSLIFDWKNFRYHFDFGYKITLTGLIDTIYNNLYNIVIGKYFAPGMVGYYTQADTLRLFPVAQLSSVLGKVTYPLFSSIENDLALKNTYRKIMRMVLFFVIPTMIILMIVAEPLFNFILGPKWLPAVPFFQVLCLASIVRPIGTYNLNILKVKGRSDLLLKLEVFKKSIGVIVLMFALPYGILALVWSLAITSFLFAFLNGYYCGRLIGYALGEQLKDFIILIAVGALCGLIVYIFYLQVVGFINSDLLKIVSTSFVFFTIYIILSYISNRVLIADTIQLLRLGKNPTL